MINFAVSEEFIGQLGISFKDGSTIYAYDELTRGLYQFTLGSEIINTVIPFADLARSTSNRIIGISKKGNEIILIPIFLNSEWIFYDTKERKIRYETIVDIRIQIWGVITMGSDLFLIPAYPTDPIVIFSLSNMKITKIYENWYEKRKGKMIKLDEKAGTSFIWGVFTHENKVFFPIVYSKEMVCVDRDKVKIVSLDIPYPIYSICISKDKFWVLPMSGEYLYIANLEGDIIGRVNLSMGPDINSKISASKFHKIITVGENVFLLPIYGENIYVYQYEKRQTVRIEVKDARMLGRLFAPVVVPYIDFIIEEKTLHLLPCGCRYKKIHIDSLESEECSLYFRNFIEREEYWKRIWDVQKDSMIEKGSDDLEDFFRLIFHVWENTFSEGNKATGRRIWEYMNENI